MTRTCTICTHDHRSEIDACLVRREPYRDIAGRYDVSTSSLARHAKVHLPEELKRAEQARLGEEADELLQDLRRLHVHTMLILRKAEYRGELGNALRAIREARENMAFMLRKKEVDELERRLEELEEGAKAS